MIIIQKHLELYGNIGNEPDLANNSDITDFNVDNSIVCLILQKK